MANENFRQQLEKALQFLSQSEVPYLVIGGLASGILGEPRFTADCDILLFVNQERISDFLTQAQACGLEVDTRKALEDFKNRLCFQMKLGSLDIDCLVATSLFETEILQHCLKVPFGKNFISVPSPEDFILLKLLVGRDKDLLDAKTVALRHQSKLDIAYLKKQAKALQPSNKSLFLDRLNNLLLKII